MPQDILKLSLIGAVYPDADLAVALPSDEACHSIRGWVLHAAQVHGIQLMVVGISDATRKRLLEAQQRQYR